MGWGPPKNVIELIRDGYTLRLICPCGYDAEPDLEALRTALHKLSGWRFDLADLPHNLRCGQCGGKKFSYELIPLARRCSADPLKTAEIGHSDGAQD